MNLLEEYRREHREMRRMLMEAGFAPEHAIRLSAEGMGPEELRVRLRVPPHEVGSLDNTHNFHRRQSPKRVGSLPTIMGELIPKPPFKACFR